MTHELVVLLGNEEVGRLARGAGGRLSFSYESRWRSAAQAYPLSLSMPLAQREHRHAAIDAYVWGLLPDNDLTLERWAARFQVSSANAFALLAHVGEDCAGAVRFVTPDRVDALTSEGVGSVDWLREGDVAQRLRELRRDSSAGRLVGDGGQFSLAGAQPKTALVFDGKRWGVPSGRIPTTHILKPAPSELEGHVANEHFCLSLARQLGLPVTRSHIARFEDEVAIAVERYDRIRSRDDIIRVHQEDVCQALAIHPVRKYENEGGPGARAVVSLLRANSSHPLEDVDTFVDALAYGWLVAGTDGHAKNYSLLIGAEGKVRLAPLYDVASALPYHGLRSQKLKLAMKIGGKYRLRDIGVYQFRKLAAELDLDARAVLSRTQDMAETPERASSLFERSVDDGMAEPALRQLVDALEARARRCARELRAVKV